MVAVAVTWAATVPTMAKATIAARTHLAGFPKRYSNRLGMDSMWYFSPTC